MHPTFGFSERARRWGHLPAPKPNAAATVVEEIHSIFSAARHRIHATLGNTSWKTTAPVGHVMLWITR